MEQLTAEGDLTADWRETFLAVSRHLFIPDTVWRQDLAIDGPNDLVPVHRRESPEEWLEIAYANRAVTVQVDDGYSVGPDGRGRDISSSAGEELRSLVTWLNEEEELRGQVRLLEAAPEPGSLAG